MSTAGDSEKTAIGAQSERLRSHAWQFDLKTCGREHLACRCQIAIWRNLANASLLGARSHHAFAGVARKETTRPCPRKAQQANKCQPSHPQSLSVRQIGRQQCRVNGNLPL